MKKYILIISIGTAIIFNACTKSNNSPVTTDPCDNLSFKFSTDVQPIINTSCVSCHGVNSTNSGGALTNYNNIFSNRFEIKEQLETGQMPKTGSLTVDQKNKIICCITSGAPNN